MQSYLRQLTLLPQDKIINTNILIVGCGNLGSVLAPILSKMGVQTFLLYDSDLIEEHNISNQSFNRKDIAKVKVFSLEETLIDVHPTGDIFVFSHDYNFPPIFPTSREFPPEFAFILTDSIDSRVSTYLTLKKYGKVKYVFEVGTHRELANIYIIDMNNDLMKAHYENVLQERRMATGEEPACTERATYFYATFFMSALTSYFVKVLNSEKVPYHVILDAKNLTVFEEELPNTKPKFYEDWENLPKPSYNPVITPVYEYRGYRINEIFNVGLPLFEAYSFLNNFSQCYLRTDDFRTRFVLVIFPVSEDIPINLCDFCREDCLFGSPITFCNKFKRKEDSPEFFEILEKVFGKINCKVIYNEKELLTKIVEELLK